MIEAIAFFVGMFMTPYLISQVAVALVIAFKTEQCGAVKRSIKIDNQAWFLIFCSQFVWAVAWTIVYVI